MEVRWVEEGMVAVAVAVAARHTCAAANIAIT